MSQTNINATVEIAVDGSGSSTPDYQNADLDLSGFQALLFEKIPDVGQLGDTGVNDTFVDYPTWGSRLARKQKGSSSGQEPELRCLQPRSGTEQPGLAALKAAGDTNNNVAIKCTWEDGHVEYIRCLVRAPALAKGENQAFREMVFGLGINQKPVFDDES
jgi:hypothetical protein